MNYELSYNGNWIQLQMQLDSIIAKHNKNPKITCTINLLQVPDLILLAKLSKNKWIKINSIFNNAKDFKGNVKNLFEKPTNIQNVTTKINYLPNKNPIDIVVPWVNPKDDSWFKDYAYWKEKVTGENSAVRFRDAEIFNYWFRSIETNCSWCRYIFLILASPSQIPNWLNINNSKLKIIYHKDFIPESELPTFNSSVINMYIPFIKDLSENYLLFNDDFFVIKPTKESDWFTNDKPIFYLMHESYRRNGSWSENIINSKELAKKFTGKYCDSNPEHGPIPNTKSLNLFYWNKYKDLIKSHLTNTKFRMKINVTDWIFFFITESLKKYVRTNIMRVNYHGDMNITNNNRLVACFNDTPCIKDYDEFKKKAKNYLNDLFPNKSSFEKRTVVATMTSYPKRIDAVSEFIDKFFTTQTSLPDYFYLWLSTKNFTNKESDLPKELIDTCSKYNVLIKWVDYDDGCTKRWNVYPKHYNDYVVALDEDNVYDYDLIKRIREYPFKSKTIYTVFGSLVNYLVCNNSINFKYVNYKKHKGDPLHIKLSGNSVIPPGNFPLNALDSKYLPLRLKYCKRCDESWLQPFYRCNGIKSVDFGLNKFKCDDSMNSTGMSATGKHINGVWWKNLQMYIVLRLFPNLMKKWKTIFKNYNTSTWDKLSLDELNSLLG